MVKIRIGDLLVDSGLITEAQLNSALNIQKQTVGKREKIGNILIDLEIITQDQLVDALKRRLNLEVVKLSTAQIPDKLLELIPVDIAREKTVIPYRMQGNTLIVATFDPLDYETFNQISSLNGKTIEPVIATRNDINDAINKFYNRHAIDSMANDLNVATKLRDSDIAANLNLDEIENRLGDVPVVKFINNLIEQGFLKRASDIHIEPLVDTLRIRFRIDGELVEIVRMSLNAHASIITRLKIMAEMDIAEKRIPLDGRFNVAIKDSEISVRAASMPTLYGEKIVLRLMIDSKTGILPLESLGFTDEHAREMRLAIKSPNGLILVTGPTGSGKSTTLYSLLNELSDVGSNVLSVEDPVEKAVPGVNQTQVNEKAGLTFAAGLRAILRQDPDKIMIGEIRDTETADIAARSAMTGHLVLASMHTNSAASAFMRLVDMGIEPYIVASSVIAVAAQRLVRLICPYCKEEYILTSADAKFLETMQIDTTHKFYKGKGCSQCEFTGSLGRTAVMELISNDSKIRDMIVAKAKSSDIEEYLTSLRNQRYIIDNALALVLEGKIFLRELLNLSQMLDF